MGFQLPFKLFHFHNFLSGTLLSKPHQLFKSAEQYIYSSIAQALKWMEAALLALLLQWQYIWQCHKVKEKQASSP